MTTVTTPTISEVEPMTTVTTPKISEVGITHIELMENIPFISFRYKIKSSDLEFKD
jgi:1,4-alpha-glucan branching enzyme